MYYPWIIIRNSLGRPWHPSPPHPTSMVPPLTPFSCRVVQEYLWVIINDRSLSPIKWHISLKFSWPKLYLGRRVSKRCDRATARSRKYFQRLRKIWVFERKNAQFTTVLPFLGNFSTKKKLFLAHFVCAKLSNRNIGRAKKKCFYKVWSTDYLVLTLYHVS